MICHSVKKRVSHSKKEGAPPELKNHSYFITFVVFSHIFSTLLNFTTLFCTFLPYNFSNFQLLLYFLMLFLSLLTFTALNNAFFNFNLFYTLSTLALFINFNHNKFVAFLNICHTFIFLLPKKQFKEFADVMKPI